MMNTPLHFHFFVQIICFGNLSHLGHVYTNQYFRWLHISLDSCWLCPIEEHGSYALRPGAFFRDGILILLYMIAKLVR